MATTESGHDLHDSLEIWWKCIIYATTPRHFCRPYTLPAHFCINIEKGLHPRSQSGSQAICGFLPASFGLLPAYCILMHRLHP